MESQRNRKAIRCAWNFRALVQEAESGRVVREIRKHNLYLNTGIHKLRDLLGYPKFLTVGWTPAYCAVGTDGTAVLATDTALGGEVFRKAITRREALDDGLIFYTSILADEANGYTLEEFGIFTEAVAGGDAWARVTVPEITKTVALVVNSEWTWTVTAE